MTGQRHRKRGGDAGSRQIGNSMRSVSIHYREGERDKLLREIVGCAENYGFTIGLGVIPSEPDFMEIMFRHAKKAVTGFVNNSMLGVTVAAGSSGRVQFSHAVANDLVEMLRQAAGKLPGARFDLIVLK